jgi:23S rRNA (guanine2445-N2)-methyltransferase / 23S rRNA (guanine2069-N7)-methyltransferase
MTDRHRLFATAPRGVESMLAAELRVLGADEVAEKVGGVSCAGTLETAYRACLWSRLASRVLLLIEEFEAATPDALYRGARGIDWSAHLDPDATLAVDFNTRRSAIDHSHFGAQKVKDAIVDEIRATHGRRPSVRLEHPDLRINVHLDRDHASVYLDLSGDSLHRRGYRAEGGAAPLKENLAAAILVRAGWPAVAAVGGALIDPMCGSGTLPIEAALIAHDLAPGALREYFGFLGWQQHDRALWRRLRAEADARRRAGLQRTLSITGYDHDRRAVAAALAHVERAELRGVVHLERCELAQIRPSASTGLVVANPPYGHRLGDEGTLGPLYASLGELLRAHFTGWQAAVFTGNAELGFRLGLRSKRPIRLYNGAIECSLLRFDVAPDRFLAPGAGSGPPRRDRADRILRAARRHRDPADAAMFANRLRKNLKHLGRWARQHDIECYRVYDADLPEYALAVDLYRAESLHAHVQEYRAPADIDPEKADARLAAALAVVADVAGITPECLHLKVRERQKGRAQYARQADRGEFHLVREGGCRFRVNFDDYLDTGLFLDHRIIRAIIRDAARDQRFLNLFCYTGTATVCAALGGARASLSIDLSKTYLDWAAHNLALNEAASDRHVLLQEDCLEWLEAEAAKSPQARARFDLILLAPPTFSNSKRMARTFDVERDHAALIARAAALLAPRGRLLFATNFRRFRLDAEGLAELDVEDLSRRTLPRDFARSPRSHHCWEIRQEGAADRAVTASPAAQPRPGRTRDARSPRNRRSGAGPRGR